MHGTAVFPQANLEGSLKLGLRSVMWQRQRPLQRSSWSQGARTERTDSPSLPQSDASFEQTRQQRKLRSLLEPLLPKEALVPQAVLEDGLVRFRVHFA